MRISEHLLDYDKTGPWADIAKRTDRKFRRTTGRIFDGEMLSLAAHLSARPAGKDEVMWGFARRAVQQMKAVCSECGMPAKRRKGQYRGVYLCASCQLPHAFKSQLNVMLRAQDEQSGVARSVLGWHQIQPLVRQAIPVYMWRNLALPDGSNLPYLTDRDFESIDTWLFRLSLVLERAAGERAAARLKDEAS
jgi:ribosomal protein L37AE/L43A